MSDLEKIYRLYLKCNQNITIDSRSPNIKNSIFFGIKGSNFDGNLFGQQAIENGASFAVLNTKKNSENKQFIYVPDTLKTLQSLANLHRNNFSIPIIAITGTNGKTTTKEILNALISSECNTCSTKGNLNNHIGVPLTLLKLEKKHNIGILELGANHAGEIGTLCKIIDPTHGIITNIGEAHLKGFGSIQNILKTKSELYHYLKKHQGTIFVDKNNEELTKIAGDYKKIHFYDSITLDSNMKNNSIFECHPFIKLFWKNKKIQTKIIGDYNINNIIAAISMAEYFNIKESSIINKLKNLELKNNRSEFIQTNNNTIILDAYNANPTSVTFAIKNFIRSRVKSDKKAVIILGDMLELGKNSNLYHQRIVNLVEKSKIKHCMLIGPLFKKTKSPKEYIKISNLSECKAILKKESFKNANILIKGSRKMKLEEILNLL